MSEILWHLTDKGILNTYYLPRSACPGPPLSPGKMDHPHVVEVWRWGQRVWILFFLFLAALGLHCCAWAFSGCGERGLLSSWDAWAFHCGGFSWCRAQLQGAGLRSWHTCLAALQHVESSRTRDQTCVPCTGKGSYPLYHQRESSVPRGNGSYLPPPVPLPSWLGHVGQVLFSLALVLLSRNNSD